MRYPKLAKNKQRFLWDNNFTYTAIYERLLNIAIASIKWRNMPPEIDVRFLEKTLCEKGMAVFFKEDIVNQYIALTCTVGGNWNIYNIPNERRAYATNGYQKQLNASDSVLIFNNYERTSMVQDLKYYAYKLYNIYRTFDINMHAQKTPILILAEEDMKLTMENLYAQYDGNKPVIKGYKSQINPDAVKVLKTDAPYLCDKLMMAANQVWADALAYMGVIFTGNIKAERVITGEMEATTGLALVNREVRISARKQSTDMINRMFGLDLEPEFSQPALGLELFKDNGAADTNEGVD